MLLEERGVLRSHQKVLAAGLDGEGMVTSGTFSPSLEMGIGMAYLPSERAAVGTEFEIDVRGKHRRARVETRPLLKV